MILICILIKKQKIIYKNLNIKILIWEEIRKRKDHHRRDHLLLVALRESIRKIKKKVINQLKGNKSRNNRILQAKQFKEHLLNQNK